MAEIEFDCLTSGNLFAGNTFFHDACVIDVRKIIDTNHVSVQVYPLHEARIDVILLEDQATNFRDFIVPFRITATTIFYSTSKFTVLRVCKIEDEPDPVPEPDPLDPLRITAINSYDVSDPEGIIADVVINGVGTGILTITWGEHGTTTHTINGAGQYHFENTMPHGDHQICGSIGDSQECTKIVYEPDPDPVPDPSTCKYCTHKDLTNLKITELLSDRQVPAGEAYTITLMVTDISLVFGDLMSLCLHDRDTLALLYNSGPVSIGAKESIPFQITGTMPNNDLKLKLSLVDDNIWPFEDDCEDFKDFTITQGEYKPPLEDEDILLYVGLAVVAALGIFMLSKR